MNDSLLIIIPVYNEEKTLHKVLDKIIVNDNIDILVVNDCSTDNTKDVLSSYSVKYLENDHNLGYEGSLNRAFNIYKTKYDYIATCDGDNELDISSLQKYFINNKDFFDIVIFNRNRFNRISEHICNFYFKYKFSIIDPLSGMKIYRCSSFLKDNFDTDNEVGTKLVKLALKRKLIIKNYPTIVRKREDLSRYSSDILSNLKIIKNVLFK